MVNSVGVPSTSSTIANARWADPDDIFNRYAYKDGDIWLGRNPHNGDQAVGYSDNKHVMVCAGSRSGKGRSFIVNNLALWTGSTVVYDPKGELPIILAARRGSGDEYCEGMEQDVFVLDPLLHSGVDSKYLAYFDPLAGLDPNDGELPTWARRIANAIIKAPENTESSQWAKRASRYIALVIMHVLTFREYQEHERTLRTVLRLVLAGEVEASELWNKRISDEIEAAKLEDREPRLSKEDHADPYKVLLAEMQTNTAHRGHIADEARNLMRLMKSTPKYFESVRGEAADQLDWFKSEGIEKCLTGIKGYDENRNPVYLPKDRQLDPDRLKTDPKGISVFIVMQVEDLETYEPWLQLVFIGLFAAMRKTKGMPAAGKQVLTILDEFSSLGYQDYIVKSLDSIAGSGMKLVTVVQNFGSLKKLYEDRRESFFTNAGLEIYFGKIGELASDYLKKELGETEIVRLARSQNRSESGSETKGDSIAFGETESHGGSDSRTSGSSSSQNWNWSNSVNFSDSKNWGESDGRNMGRNYGPHVLFQPLEGGSSYGTSLSRNRGGTHTKSASKAKGGGSSYSTNESQTTGSSWNQGTSKTTTQNWSTTKGYSIGGGIAETFHKKPLLEPHEINTFLQSYAEEDRDHPAYPGLMLVRMEGENPTFLRRSNYDQDIVFEGCFTPDPAYKFIPIKEQELLGYQYTEDQIVTLLIPQILWEAGFEASTHLRPMMRFGETDTLFTLRGTRTDPNSADILKTQKIETSQIWKIRGRVMDVMSPEEQSQTGYIITVKLNRPWGDEANRIAARMFYHDLIADVENRNKRLHELKQIELEKQKLRDAQNAKRVSAIKALEDHKNELKELFSIKNISLMLLSPLLLSWILSEFGVHFVGALTTIFVMASIVLVSLVVAHRKEEKELREKCDELSGG